VSKHARQRPLATLDEQPEDAAIIDSIAHLATLIDGHSRNFYSRGEAFRVCQIIGQIIVDEAINEDGEGMSRNPLLL
jgi:hypothetical protein